MVVVAGGSAVGQQRRGPGAGPQGDRDGLSTSPGRAPTNQWWAAWSSRWSSADDSARHLAVLLAAQVQGQVVDQHLPHQRARTAGAPRRVDDLGLLGRAERLLHLGDAGPADLGHQRRVDVPAYQRGGGDDVEVVSFSERRWLRTTAVMVGGGGRRTAAISLTKNGLPLVRAATRPRGRRPARRR
jgi:hypothetical protein